MLFDSSNKRTSHPLSTTHMLLKSTIFPLIFVLFLTVLRYKEVLPINRVALFPRLFPLIKQLKRIDIFKLATCRFQNLFFAKHYARLSYQKTSLFSECEIAPLQSYRGVSLRKFRFFIAALCFNTLESLSKSKVNLVTD